MKISMDSREGAGNTEITGIHCKLDRALDWFQKLDGIKHTLISLDREDSSQMMIGGGPNEFVVSLSKDDADHTLTNSQASGDTTSYICVGGQYGDFPDSMRNDSKATLTAIRTYFESAEDTLDWVKTV